MTGMDQFLPGSPRRRLVIDVRRRLGAFSIRPMHDPWRTTWEWARNIALSYSKPMWPTTTEIVAQYLVLLLHDVRKTFGLKLPYRATHPGVLLPDAVLAALASTGATPESERPMLGAGAESEQL